MVKKLIKSGNSFAFVIDRAVLELLNITPDTPIKMSTDGDEIRLTPLRVAVSKESVDQSLDRLYAKHGAVMKRLAE